MFVSLDQCLMGVYPNVSLVAKKVPSEHHPFRPYLSIRTPFGNQTNFLTLTFHTLPGGYLYDGLCIPHQVMKIHAQCRAIIGELI